MVGLTEADILEEPRPWLRHHGWSTFPSCCHIGLASSAPNVDSWPEAPRLASQARLGAPQATVIHSGSAMAYRLRASLRRRPPAISMTVVGSSSGRVWQPLREPLEDVSHNLVSFGRAGASLSQAEPVISVRASSRATTSFCTRVSKSDSRMATAASPWAFSIGVSLSESSRAARAGAQCP
jgi:hypothetical protein